MQYSITWDAKSFQIFTSATHIQLALAPVRDTGLVYARSIYTFVVLKIDKEL